MSIDAQELERRFADLATLDAAQRLAALRELAVEAPQLAQRLAALLDAHDATHDPLHAVQEEALRRLSGFDPESLLGRRIGDWTLTRLIGRGGMGVVYEGHHEQDGVDQEVAIKLLSAPLFDARAGERFVHEARILARLDHPGICRLRDWGRTPEGWHYLVLDLVRGEALSIDGGERTLRDKLATMARIADAVAAAHRQLVAHLDLKPANVRMADERWPVLLDFGVSRMLNDGTDGGATLTRWLTPRYASPEQLRGEPASAAADIYALGVMLYEQISGEPPFDLDQASVTEILRRIEQGASPLRKRAGGSTRDLNAICARAMHFDPGRRYASADAFADDLRAVLERRPVSARPDSIGYRISRMFARNPVALPAGVLAVAAVTTLAVLLAFQAADLARQRDRAETAAQRASSATSLLLESIRAADPTGDYGAEMKLSDLIEQTAARLDGELSAAPRMHIDTLLTLADVRRALGQHKLAIPMYEQARSILVDDLAGAADREAMDLELAIGLAEALRGDDRVEDAIQVAESALGESVGIPAPALRMVLARAKLAQSLEEDAESQVQHALLELAADDIEAHADAFALLGEIDMSRYRYAEALAWQQRALDRLGDSPAWSARRASVLSAMAFNHSRLADHELAEANASAALELRVAQYGEQHPATVRTLLDLGYVLDDAGEWRRALEVVERGMRIESELSQGQSRRMERLLSFASTLHRRLEDSETALKLLLQARDLAERLYPPDHRLLGNVYSNLGALYSDFGDMQASIAAQRKAHAVYEAKDGDKPSRGRFIAAANLAAGLCDDGQAAEGLVWAGRAVHEADRMLKADSWLRANVHMNLATCLFGDRQYAEAEAEALGVLRAYEASGTPVQPSALKDNFELLVQIKETLGQAEQAALYRRKLAALDSPPAADPES